MTNFLNDSAPSLSLCGEQEMKEGNRTEEEEGERREEEEKVEGRKREKISIKIKQS